MSMMRLPLNIWGMFASSLISLLVFPVLLAAGVLLLADRMIGTSFFVPGGLVLGDAAVPHSGGHPLLWQHLFWFFGHPEVYIVIVPAMGVAAEILATFIRKPVFGYKIMVWCWLAIVALSMIVWGRHMFVRGMNPFLGGVFALTTLMITIPSAILVLCWVMSLWGADPVHVSNDVRARIHIRVCDGRTRRLLPRLGMDRHSAEQHLFRRGTFPSHDGRVSALCRFRCRLLLVPTVLRTHDE
jgi:heme/copper-type cytochrome/quinol oxidase subunit 1